MISNIMANNETFCTKNRLILAVKFSLFPPSPGINLLCVILSQVEVLHLDFFLLLPEQNIP